MSLRDGAIGVVAGFILFVVSSIGFQSAQYMYPTQAAVWFTIAIISLLVMFGSPVYYWLWRPIRRYTA